jgi:hypothetical protein
MIFAMLAPSCTECVWGPVTELKRFINSPQKVLLKNLQSLAWASAVTLCHFDIQLLHKSL